MIFSKKPRHNHHCFDLVNEIIHLLICICIPLFIFGDSSGNMNCITPERLSGIHCAEVSHLSGSIWATRSSISFLLVCALYVRLWVRVDAVYLKCIERKWPCRQLLVRF